MTLTPPDEWDSPGTGSNSTEPAADAATGVRTAWIAAMRRHHEAYTGVRSNYSSKPRWDGGFDRRLGRMYKKNYWCDVVETAAQYGVDPLQLVEQLFANWSSHTAPLPTMLIAPDNVTRTLKAKATAKTTTASDLRTEEAVFTADTWGARQTIPDPQAADHHVLNDTGRPLSPLFRYIAARLRGYDAIAARWRAAAHKQFMKSPDAYLASWGKLIPDEFKTPAFAGPPL